MNDDGRLVIVSNFYTDAGEIRINKLKIIPHSDFAHVYVNSGKTKEGNEKYANIRLSKDQLKKLKNYLNALEIT